MSADPEGRGDLRADAKTRGPAAEAVGCHEDLVKLLAEQFALADVSLRELQARADKAGGTRLPRATCADMLAGRRFPKRAVMMAFLRACHVAEDQLPAWERAWERVRVTRLPAGAGETDRSESPRDTPPAVQASGADETGARDPGPGRRKAVVPAAVAAVAALATAVILGVLIGQRAAPRHGASQEPPHRTVVGSIVTDDGRAFGPGGSSRFTVVVDPANTGVRLIRRLDAGVPLQQATVTVNGAPAGRWRPLLGDSDYKWRNQIFDIPPALTAGRRSLTIVNTFVSSYGFNEFLYVIEQKVNGSWSTADRIDIGPDHTASEAAHDYRIVGEGWRGTQTFAYPPLKEDWTVQ
ncbi:hypothetical protein [Nonomuraea dietziae]|uniref:hypothetical protein n=1 Tax=Nonomuraea dietziae TaxID=65515 RepID=UPI00344968CE